MSVEEAFQQASNSHRAGRLAEAAQLYRMVLAQDPRHAAAHANLGTLLLDSGHVDEAVASIQRAVAIQPANPQLHFFLGNALSASRRYADAIAAFQAALQRQPDHIGALVNLGVVLHSLYWSHERAIGPAAPQDRLALLHAAVETLRAAMRIDPRRIEPYQNLGNVLCTLGRWTDAIETCRQGIAIQPNDAGLHATLSVALRETGDSEGALAQAKQALAIDPESAIGRESFARALREKGDVDEAIDAAADLVQARCDAADRQRALNLYADLLFNVGRGEDALAAYRRAVDAAPDDWATGSSYLFTLQFCSEDPQLILAEHRKWDNRHAAPLRSEIRPAENDRSAGRRLRVGCVSPDFRNHIQALFTVPLLSHHNREAVEVYCYSTTRSPDAVTARIQQLAGVWRDVAWLSDAAIADAIRRDRIDVLVDLTMHMSGGRPLVFARKPAPVQVAWLAYPGTTGLSAMDYRLTDPHLDPPGFECRYSERSIYLPETFWCYDPCGAIPRESQPLPEVNALPALANGFITFGCLNHFAKLTAPTIRKWGQLMRRVPRSRLRLLAPRGRSREKVLAELHAFEIAPDRVEFVDRQPRQAYMAEYRNIDLCLDTFPVNGHTTSLDAFWMGVPVLTQLGPTALGRAGLSQLTNLKLPGFVAKSDEQFIELAKRWSSDLSALAQIRGELRGRMSASPLMDAPRFARAMEAAFAAMWRTR